MISRSPAHGRARALVLVVASAFACACAVALAAALPARAAEGAESSSSTPPSSPTSTATPTSTPTAPSTPTPGASSVPAATATAAPAGSAAEPADALEEIVIVGRRPRAQADADPTAAATVVEAERFAGEAKGVAELVATAPGVAIDDYGGLGHLTTVSIRGSTADGVLVLLDGLTLNTAAGGGVDLSSIPRHWIDRIEVVRGPEGALYGAGALGGVVNVVTRGARAGRWSAEATAGSFDTYAAAAEASGALGGGSILAALSAESTGGTFSYRFDPQRSIDGNALEDAWRRNNGVRRAALLSKLTLPWGGARVDALAHVSAGRREVPGTPRGLTEGWQEDARALLSARVTAPGPLGLLLAARGSLRLDRLEARVGAGVADQRGGAASLETEALLERGGALLRVAALAEGEALRSIGLPETRTRGTLAATAAGDLFLADGRVRVAPALRAERIGVHDGVSAKLGASARVVGPLLLRASAGRTFRAPSFAQLYLQQGTVDPNPELRSEIGVGADVSVVLETPRAFATAGAHATLYRDLVFYQQTSPGRLKPFNSDEALVRGLELELATTPARELLGLSAAASYTLLATESLRGPPATAGNELPLRPRHRVFARLAVAPGPATAHVEAHLVGRRWGDPQNLDPIPRSTSWNAGASIRLARHPALALHLELKNLLDDRTVVDAFDNPLPGRTVLVTLRAGSPTEGSP